VAFGIVFHGAFAATVPFPVDMDAQYYLLVAQHLVAGEGAVTDSLWNLSWRPESLPVAADVHWMPLPSRVLVPFLALAPVWGAAVAQVLLAASWGPLAAWLAEDAGGSEREALVAGVLASTGGVYVRYLSMPDCYALYGVLGTVGLVAVARGRVPLAALVAVLAAWTRNDGFLLGLCLAAGLGRRGLPVAAAGIGGTAVWTLRNHLLAGAGFWEARSIAAHASDYLVVFDGVDPAPLGVLGHLLGPVTHADALLEYLLTPGLLLLTPFTAYGLYADRGRPWVRSLVLLVVAVPVVSLVLAPTIAVHGTLYRSAAATLPAQVALGTVWLFRAGRRAAELRGYPPVFLPALIGGGFGFLVVSMGAMRAVEPVSPAPCEALARLPDGPVFASNPLELELRCGRAGVMVTQTTPAERVRALAEQHGVRHLVTSGRQDEGSVRDADVARLLPDWNRVGEGLWAAP
jgi:hypothetical protein